MRRFHANFTYQAGKLDQAAPGDRQSRMHPGELYPRVGFIVTNLSRPADRVVAFYNKRETCEQWIKEGKGAIKWTRLSCRTFAANAVRLQLHAKCAEKVAKIVGERDRPEGGVPRTLCRLPNGGGRHPTTMFQEILRLIAELRPQPPPAPA